MSPFDIDRVTNGRRRRSWTLSIRPLVQNFFLRENNERKKPSEDGRVYFDVSSATFPHGMIGKMTGKIGSKRLIKILRFFLFHFQPPTTNDFLTTIFKDRRNFDQSLEEWKKYSNYPIIHEERKTFVSRRQRRVGKVAIVYKRLHLPFLSW